VSRVQLALNVTNIDEPAACCSTMSPEAAFALGCC